MHIYRLEDSRGKGPYNGGAMWDDPRPKPSYLENLYTKQRGIRDPHPAPTEDGLGRVYPGDYFGFDSPEAMQSWFFREPYDAERLEDFGLFVTIWEVAPHCVRRGGKQVVFIRDEATQIRNMTPTEFMEEVTSWQNPVRH